MSRFILSKTPSIKLHLSSCHCEGDLRPKQSPTKSEYYDERVYASMLRGDCFFGHITPSSQKDILEGMRF